MPGTSNPATGAGSRAAALGRGLAAGGIVSVWSVTNALAYAGLVFAGLSAVGLQVGVSSILLGLTVVSLLMAMGQTGPGIAYSAFGSAAVLHAAAVRAADGVLEAKGIPAGLAREGALVLASGAITAMAGLALAALGAARLGSLVRLLPNPVAFGFFGGLGAAFAAGGIALATGLAPRPGTLAAFADPGRLTQLGVALGLALVLVVLPRRTRHGAAIPALLAIAILAFHAIRLLLGATVPEAQQAGWLLGPFPSGRILSFPPAESLALLDWELAGVLLPYAASSALLCAITLALMVTGIEALTARPMNVDREMRLAGIANVAGGALGGLPTAHALSATTFLARERPVGRWVAAVPAAVALVILFSGADALELVPRTVLAALLLAVGIEWLVIRTWREARLLPRHEVAILLVVGASIVVLGIVEGILIGLGLALLIFAWTYRRVPVIRGLLRGHEMRSSVSRSAAMTRVLDEQGRRIVVMRLQGYMFFLNAETVQKVFAWATRNDARHVVLDFRHVLGMDSAAVEVFARLERDARELGLRLSVAAVPDVLDGPFTARGVFLAPGCPRFPSVHQALEHAEELLLLEHGERVDTERASLVALLAAEPELEDAGPRLAPFIERVAFAPAETLMLQGEPARDMVFVESGRVQAMLLKEGAAPLHLRTLTPGTLVGEIALVRGGDRTATVVAVTPCEAVRIDRDGLARMQEADPALAFAIHRLIMRQLTEKLVENTRAMDLALR